MILYVKIQGQFAQKKEAIQEICDIFFASV